MLRQQEGSSWAVCGVPHSPTLSGRAAPYVWRRHTQEHSASVTTQWFIATGTFGVTLGATYLLASTGHTRVAWLNLGVNIPVLGLPLPLGLILPSFGVALVFRMAKLHDRISDVFRIRHRFDIDCILLPMAAAAGLRFDTERIRKVEGDRKRLMREVFYRYAKAQGCDDCIDPHDVHMALDQWSYFWMPVEGLAVLLPTGVGLVVLGFGGRALLVGAIVLVLLTAMLFLKAGCRRYARVEVEEILRDPGRRNAIVQLFHAL